MRLALLSLAAFLGLALCAQAAENRSPAIESVIQQQLDAFQAGDVSTAFTFASPNIKSIFGDEGRFGLMVQSGFPMVWRHSDFRFLELREIAGRLWQKVMVTDMAGRVHILDYQMIETQQGWQINAVQILEMQSIGA